MAAQTRERPRNWWIWAVAGVVVALLVIGAWQFASRTQGGDLPRPSELAVEVPAPPTLPETPTLPPSPLPTPR